IRLAPARMARLLGAGLWKLRPWSRAASWGKSLYILERYLQKNSEEVRILRINELLHGVPEPPGG
ncbi:MAG: hypothetical protein HUU37_04430, partial [Bdellovibrionales bacterium]|nr:hypothetical protein [Bdellovibrionales bacterium]